MKRAITFVALAALLLISGLTAQSQTLAGPAAPTDIQATLNAFVSGKPGVGVVAGVVSNGATRIYTAGSLGAGAPELDQNTVFQIGSVTKTFTATLLALMSQSGQVKLSDPIAKYLSPGVRAPSYNGNAITLLDLAEQNSGLPRLPSNLTAANPVNPYAAYTPQMLDSFLSSYSLTRAPGAQYEYSNLGVGLLGDLLARRAGVSYGTLVQSRVLRPLGMTQTSVSPTAAMQTHFAPGHTIDGNLQQPWTFGELGAAGAIDSTLHDMLIYLHANMAKPPSTKIEKAMAFAQQPRFPIGLNGAMKIGLVWQTNVMSGITWHNGETGGYHAFMGFNKSKGFGIVLLTNIADESADTVAVHILAPNAVAAPTPQPAAVDVPLSTLQRYVGTYQLTPAFDLVVTVKDGKLYEQATGQDAFQLYPSSPTTFYLKVVDAQITFNLDASGNVTSLTLHQGGANRTAAKIK